MNKRYIGAIILSPLLIILYFGGIYLRTASLILSIFGLKEFYTVFNKKHIYPLKSVGYILCVLYFFFLSNNMDYRIIVYTLVGTIFILLCIPVINNKYTLIDISITIIGMLYIPVLFSFIVLINLKNNGNYLIWIVFISSWLCDTSAYYTGKFFGRNKLCPIVSPKKTIEGSIGGLLGSAISCTIYGLFINSKTFIIPIYHFLVIGTLCGVFCQFGDLVASYIKRFCGVKDYSDIIPGHGGVLDRFDSILFSSLVVYYYLTFIIGI